MTPDKHNRFDRNPLQKRSEDKEIPSEEREGDDRIPSRELLEDHDILSGEPVRKDLDLTG